MTESSGYVCKVLSVEQQAEFLADARAGMTGAEAVERYGVSKRALARLLAHNSLGFVRRARGSEEEIRAALEAGMSVTLIRSTLGAHYDRIKVVRERMQLMSDHEKRAVVARETTARCVELAASNTRLEIAAVLGLNPSTVGKHLRRAGVQSAVPVRPARASKPRVSKPRVRDAAPVLRVVKDPKPAPIKRSKSKPPKRDPLYLTCSRKHPITKSNRVKGTLNECLVCKRRGVSLPTNLVAARDALIADLEAVIAREVAELTADLRPEMEKAA